MVSPYSSKIKTYTYAVFVNKDKDTKRLVRAFCHKNAASNEEKWICMPL